ncbi:hypothetical protein QE152_g51 [Popillia japonica]|uniref:DEK C-terminal domain-containing protein n=1 Tax=Popillia japonica TaxID=7064 RepID=A0AAW1NGS1_POPJA
MENLGQKIGYNITQAHTKEIKALHKLVFEYEGDINNRKRLREFTGFNFKDREDDKDNAIKKKTDYAMNNLTLGELSLICNVLDMDNNANNKEELIDFLCKKLDMDNNANNKEELIDFLCKKLDDVSVLTEKDVSNNDDDGEENDVNTLVKSKGDKRGRECRFKRRTW